MIVKGFLLIKDWACFQDSRTLHLPITQEMDTTAS